MKTIILTFVLTLAFSGAFAQPKEVEKLNGLIEKGKLDKAEIYLIENKSTLRTYGNKKCYSLVAEAYLDQNNIDKAIELYTKSKNKIALSKLHFENNEYDKACANCYDDQKPERSIAYSCQDLGKKCLDEGLINEAICFIDKTSGSDDLAAYYFENEEYQFAVKYCVDHFKFSAMFLQHNMINEAIACIKKSEGWNNPSTISKNRKLYSGISNYLFEHKMYFEAYSDLYQNAPEIVVREMLKNNESVESVEKLIQKMNISDDKKTKMFIKEFLSLFKYNDVDVYISKQEKSVQNNYWEFALFEINFFINNASHMLYSARIAKRINPPNSDQFGMHESLANYIFSTTKDMYEDNTELNSKPVPETIPISFLDDVYNEINPNLEYFGFEFCAYYSEKLNKKIPSIREEYSKSTMESFLNYCTD